MQSFHDLLMNAPVLITVQRGKELRLELFNLSAQKAVGDRDLTGRTLGEAFPELEQWLLKIAAVVRRGEPYVGVDEALTFDWEGTGTVETKYLTLVCQPLLGSGGAVEGSVMFAIDVTASVAARGAHACDRDGLEAALDCVATPVVLAEPGTRHILFANAAAQRLSHGDLPSGTTFGQAIGLETGYFCTDAAGARIPEDEMPATRASRGEVVDALEIRWHTPFGTIPLVCFAEVVAAARGLPTAVVLSFFDASRAERLERELLDALAARDAFLGLAGHELRTPLTALKLQLQSLLRQYPDAAGLAAVERAAQRMDALVEQLIDATRIRDVGVRLMPEDLNLSAVVDEVIDRLRPEAARSGSAIARIGPTKVPGRWDRTRLEHVLTNLLCNAIRFGSGAPIGIECQEHECRVSIAVTDGGIGLRREDQKRIFERFERAASPRHFGGLGLGLWVTREIVTQMGGSISVRSSLCQGATFTVDLPRAPPSA